MIPPKSLVSREAAEQWETDMLGMGSYIDGLGGHEAGQAYAYSRVLSLLNVLRDFVGYVPPAACADWLEAELKLKEPQ